MQGAVSPTFPIVDTRSILNDPQKVKKIAQVALQRAAKARDNIGDFFEWVMVEEHTRAPIKVAPHQRVLLDFVMAHDRSVCILPVGSSKTFSVTALTLFLLGQDPTRRGAIVSATQDQAKKPLKFVREYIEESPKLRSVFPHLRKSHREGDPWTQTAITVDRPTGIRDASLTAFGLDGALPGSRLNWIIVDDLLTEENTHTVDSREKVYRFFETTITSRLDPRGARIVVCNTTWHPDDLVHKLEAHGWPTLRMTLSGMIEAKCPVIEWADGRVEEDPWITSEIQKEMRPATPSPYEVKSRLRAHDPDPDNRVNLWPERYTVEWEAKERRERLPVYFNMLYEGICRDDETAMCQVEWIENCKRKARDKGIFTFEHEYRGNNLVFTGVDLAISPGEEHDSTAFFTFELWPDGHRRILDIEVGQFNGPRIIDKLRQKQKAYNSIMRVENNGAQDYLRQFALDKDISFPIAGHTTGRTKAHPEYGVAGIFIELKNGAWLIPNDRYGHVHPATAQWIKEMLYYVPSKHTGDILMASWFAIEQARKWGVLKGTEPDGPGGAGGGSVGMQIMAR